MKAIILAAGYATRLYPLTLTTPKPLLDVQGKPMINYIVDAINTLPEIDMIYVVTNHKFAGHFEKWAESPPGSVPVKVLDDGTSNEDTRLGAIGDIQYCIENEAIDDDLLIIAGDNLFTFPLIDFYHFFKETGKDSCCSKEIDDVSVLRQFAVAVLDGEGRITELIEKPADPPSNIGIFAVYLYKKETLPLFSRYLGEGNKPDAPGYFLQWLHQRKDVRAYKFNGECYDIGTPKAYEDVQKVKIQEN